MTADNDALTYDEYPVYALTEEDLAQIASLLTIAQRMITNAQRQHITDVRSAYQSLEPAAWRLADAGLLLRRVLERGLTDDERRNLVGFDESNPTGRGALLPTNIYDSSNKE